MNLNERFHGFRVIGIEPVEELHARMVRMEFERNGAQLIWLDRADENKTFAIAFKTVPTDDTGVFHILEHSVLCGSDKYPVKEPFVELLKSSMYTFLNAFTYPDKTIYPISSRNDADFRNLVDVYMDAVFHPLAVEDAHAFRQEGWHYELERAEDPLSINGVVYNEMKGAYASPDTVLQAEMSRLLFPDTGYRYDSGGVPEHIPELTYEHYKACHHTCYHPSNARIYLDGTMDIDAVLAQLESFLAPYERIDPENALPLQAPVQPEERTCAYEVGPEDEQSQAILAWGSVFGTFADQKEVLALSMLGDVLCGSNDSPLMRPLLEQGLAEDVEIAPMNGILQPYLLLVLRNVPPARREEAWQCVEDTFRTLAAQGLDRKQLHAALDALEFANREQDFGMPRGLIYGLNMLDSWLYDGDPAQNLQTDAVFHALREGIEEGYFERFLLALLESSHQAKLCMLPSKTLGEEKAEAEATRLDAIRAAHDDAWAEQVMAEFAAFREKQNTPDDPEMLERVPVLSLSDLPEKTTVIPQSVENIEGVTVLHQNEDTDGIAHVEFYFDLSDLPMEQMQNVWLLSRLVGQVATKHYSVLELRGELGSKLGRFNAAPTVFEKNGIAAPWLVVQMSLLESRKAEAVELLEEVLHHSDYSDGEFVFHQLRQDRIQMEQQVVEAGNAFAGLRLAGGSSASGALLESMSGITHLRWMQETEREFETRWPELQKSLEVLSDTLFSRERVTVSLTGRADPAWVAQLVQVLSAVPMGERVSYSKLEAANEGFLIPADIGFAAKAGRGEEEMPGCAFVAGQLLTYGHLWTQVRVKGGAYGTDLTFNARGGFRFTSFRDPDPVNALSAFDDAGEALRQFCDSDERVDRYIISTVSYIDPLLNPRTRGMTAARNYLSGDTEEILQKKYEEILHTDKTQLRAFAQRLDRLCEQSKICVVGGKSVLDTLKERLEHVEVI